VVVRGCGRSGVRTGGSGTFEVIVAGCVRLRKAGMSKSSHVAGTGAVPEGVFADEDGSSRGGVGGVTPEVTGSGCNGLGVQCSLGLDGCAAAAIEDLSPKLLEWLLAVGADSGGRIDSEVTAVAFDTSGAARVEDLPAGLLWLLLVGVGGDGKVTCDVTAALSAAAATEEVPAGLVWLLVVGAGGGRSMPPLRGGN
jgi:hypothetical protein